MDLREDGLLGAGVADRWYYGAKSAAVATLLGGTRPAGRSCGCCAATGCSA